MSACHASPGRAGGCARSALRQTHEHAQVVAHGLRDARLDPASALLVDHLPGRQIMGQGAPGAARPHRVAQAARLLTAGVTGTRRVAVDGPRLDLGSAPPFDGVISRPRTSGPLGTNARTSSPSNVPAPCRADQRARLSRRWELAECGSAPRPSARKAAVIVPRKEASSTPPSSACARRQLGRVKSEAKAAVTASTSAGSVNRAGSRFGW